MNYPLHNYAIKPPSPWCQRCGYEFNYRDLEWPYRLDGRDYCETCWRAAERKERVT